MSYAQINYKQLVGNSQLDIAEIGCFVTALCNTLEKVGKAVDPPTLNTFFTNNHVYTYDLTDRANDDLTWNSITKYCPQLVVAQTGTSGWPASDLAIVEFRYKSHTGAEVTHFCAVHSAADHSIIDSYDGLVKTPAQYEGVYHDPIAWATYVYHTPQTTPPGPAAVQVSAPTAVGPAQQSAPVPAPAATPRQIILPKTNNGKYYGPWHVYKPGGPYTLPYAIGALDVFQYGPLTFDILGNPVPHVYLIQTQSFGLVAIYAGPDTCAEFPGSGHGEGESTTLEVAQAASVPVSEIIPAPAPVQAQQEAPIAPTEPARAFTYVKFPAPLSLVTLEGAQRVNFVSSQVVENLPAGTPFTAVGKAQFPAPDNTAYYMNDNDFCIADQTQKTAITVGIKSSQLQAAPVVTATALGGTTVTTTSTAPAPADEQPEESSLPWQRTMTFFMSPQPYVVKESMEVYNFATGNDKLGVKRGTIIRVGGKFQYNGALYYRAQPSIEKDTWYGFPVTSLAKQDASNTPMNTPEDTDITELGAEPAASLSKKKSAALKIGGTAEGILSRLRKGKN